MHRYFFYLLSFILITPLLPGCKKWVTVPVPAVEPSTEALFSSEASARGVLSGVYSEWAAGAHFASSLTTLYCGLAADELYYYTPGLRDGFTRNELGEATHPLLSSGLWVPAYRFIYTANLALEKLPRAPLDPAVRRTLMGEARFVRAFCYLHLVGFFGGVPLVRSTDYRGSEGLARSSAGETYDALEEDLTQAARELPALADPAERLRPSRAAALALLARVHLYRGAWRAAADLSTELIGSGPFALAPTVEEVFRAAGPETIFFLPAPPPHYRGVEGAAVVPATPEALPTYLVRTEFYEAFEAGDRRRDAWTAARDFGGRRLYYPAKYSGQYGQPYTVLRLGELYLVRAEALAQLGDSTGAVADLNTLRRRAGLPALPALSPEALLATVERERRSELAFEWGHRWNDLRRTGRADAVLGALKGADWQKTDKLWPLPQDQLLLNSSLTQNPGY